MIESNNSNVDEPVTIVPYDQQWPQQFATQQRILGKSTDLPINRITHIGSTAVPGMIAKPVIDIMAGVTEYPPSAPLHRQVILQGYLHRGEAGVAERQYYLKRKPTACNLHIVLYQGSHWQNNLAIRNYLSAHAQSRERYNALKQAIINDGCNTLLPYSSAKANFLTELTQIAIKWQSRQPAANTDTTYDN
jgi:GrpB-like predicted nucleotidyltransferase (UPF0157 family)